MDDDYAKRFGEKEHPMLEITPVLGRSAIFIHIGNFYNDSLGCPLIGLQYLYDDNFAPNDYSLSPTSTLAYKEFYYPIRNLLLSGGTVKYKIKDIQTKIGGNIREKDTELKFELIQEKKPTETPVPIFKRNGFKRWLGIGLMVAGGVATVIPGAQALGGVLIKVGGSIEVIGIGHGLVKSRQSDKETSVDRNAILRIIADLIIQLFKYFSKKKS